MNIFDYIDKNKLVKLIQCAFEEDSVFDDQTSNFLFTEPLFSRAKIIAKSDGVLSGEEIVKMVFLMRDSSIEVKSFLHDGENFFSEDKIFEISGEIKSILSSERIALNFLSKLSGIATYTYEFVKKTKGRLKILDTRKTTPCYRELEKYAVKCGGGENHRMNLREFILIKENHLFPFSSIKEAVDKLRKANKKIFIEVEVKNLDELKEALTLDVQRIMLDNFTIDEIKEAVKINNGKKELEVSGGVSLESVVKISELGVQYVSVGSLTHSAKGADFSLLIEEVKDD